MKKFSEQLQKKAGSIKLSASERKALRERVSSYIEYHPLPASMQAKAPTTIKTEVAKAATESFTTIRIAWKELLQGSAVAVCVMLVAVPIFAERAVPGDTLYAVKVGFNEELRSTLTWDPYQKVEWETARLNRRLAEARLLADEGRLTGDVEAEVAAAVEEHTRIAKSEIAAIGETDAEAAAIANIEFDSTVSVQADVLAAKSATGTVAIAAALAAATTPENASSTPPTYDKLMARVEINTTRVYELLEELQARNNPNNRTALSDVTRRFEDIERTVSEAIVLRETDELEARQLLVDVLKRAQKLLVFMSDIAIQESVTVEDVVPVVLTPEEKTAVIAALNQDIDTAVAEVTVRLSAIEDVDVLEKLGTALVAVEDTRGRATSTEYVANRTLLEEAYTLAFDAQKLAERTVAKPVEVPEPEPEAATSTEEATATSTEEVVVETPEEPATTTPEVATSTEEVVVEEAASSTEAVDETI